MANRSTQVEQNYYTYQNPNSNMQSTVPNAQGFTADSNSYSANQGAGYSPELMQRFQEGQNYIYQQNYGQAAPTAAPSQNPYGGQSSYQTAQPTAGYDAQAYYANYGQNPQGNAAYYPQDYNYAGQAAYGEQTPSGLQNVLAKIKQLPKNIGTTAKGLLSRFKKEQAPSGIPQIDPTPYVSQSAGQATGYAASGQAGYEPQNSGYAPYGQSNQGHYTQESYPTQEQHSQYMPPSSYAPESASQSAETSQTTGQVVQDLQEQNIVYPTTELIMIQSTKDCIDMLRRLQQSFFLSIINMEALPEEELTYTQYVLLGAQTALGYQLYKCGKGIFLLAPQQIKINQNKVTEGMVEKMSRPKTNYGNGSRFSGQSEMGQSNLRQARNYR